MGQLHRVEQRRCGRKERFARLIHRRGRAVGGPSAHTACGGDLSLPW